MKKFLNISLLSIVAVSALSLGSCSNEVDEIFDEDAVSRLEKEQKNYIDILTDGGKGCRWQLEYFANSDEPGYVYLMTFNKDGSVIISGKNEWIAYEVGATRAVPTYATDTTLWDVITDNGPVLSFNTYSKIFHLFASPEDIPSTDTEAPDETGYGHNGDYEFDLMKFSNDTLYVTGKKRGIDMIMTRVDTHNDGRERLSDQEYMDYVVAQADSFFHARIPQVYINLPNGNRWVVKDGATSILKMWDQNQDEISTAEYHNVIITYDGLSFMNPITLDGYVLKNFIRQPDGSLLCRDDNQTTITADDLNSVFGITTFTWKADTTKFGGAFIRQVRALAKELKEFENRTLTSIQISYDSKTDSIYQIKFGCRKGKNTFTPTFNIDLTKVNGNQLRFTYTGKCDAAGALHSENCPAMLGFVELLSKTCTLTTTSLLAPVDMWLTDSEDPNSYSYWKL